MTLLLALVVIAPTTLQGTFNHLLTHVHVVEAVAIRAADDSPVERQAKRDHLTLPADYVRPVAWVYLTPQGFQIEVRTREANSLPQRPLEWVILHELCHVINDGNVLDSWSSLSDTDVSGREARADTCASSLQRRHWATCRLTYPNPLLKTPTFTRRWP